MVRKPSRTQASILTATLVGSAIAVGAAQTPAPAAPSRPDLRHQIYVMEGALSRAVSFGALQLNREFRNLSPDVMMIAGDAQARGVFLDGYGVFFDVGVPILRQSMVWSLRTILEQDDQTIKDTIAVLRMQLSAERDAGRRRGIENSISRLELQLSPMPMARRAQPQQQGLDQRVGAQVYMETPPEAPAASPAPRKVESLTPAERAILQDPNRAYTEAVQRALVEAMIDYAQPMLLGDDEFLTVAARDNEPRDSLAPQDPLEQVVTVLLRIKGADLAAYRAGKIDREEAKKRVQVREF